MQTLSPRITDRRPKNSKRIIPFFAGATLALFGSLPQRAAADDTGFYIGARVGQSKFDSETVNSSGGLGTGVVQESRVWTDDSSEAWSTTVGYRFSKYFGIESNYWSFGEASFNDTRVAVQTLFSPRTTTTSRLTAQATIKGPSLGIFGSYAFGNWEISGKLNALFTEVNTTGQLDTTQVAIIPGAPPTTTTTNSTTRVDQAESTVNLLYGASVTHVWASHYVIGIEYIGARGLGDREQFSGIDLDVVTAVFQYRF